jgi:hypothetical protein
MTTMELERRGAPGPSHSDATCRRLGRLLVAAVAAAVAWLALSPSALAAELTLAVSADPTEDEPVTVTANGSSESAAQVYVLWKSGSQGCASTAGTEDDFGGIPILDASPVAAAAAFSKSGAFTPPNSGSYVLCAYLATSRYGTPIRTAASSLSAREPFAEVALSVSADPTEEESVTVTATGSSEAGRRVYVLWKVGSQGCAATAGTEDDFGGTQIVAGAGVAAGASLSEQSVFTPQDSGHYRLCGYVTESLYDTPNAVASILITAREPTASVALSVSADPTEEELVTVTATGSSEAGRRVYVLWKVGSQGCAATAGTEDDFGGTLIVADAFVAAGHSFFQQGSFAPQSSGEYRVCAYVTESLYDTPHATTTSLLTVRQPAAQVDLTVSQDPTERKTVTVTASGSSEGARRVYVLWKVGSQGCAATAGTDDDFGGTQIVAGASLVGGESFSHQGSFTPQTPGPYRLCAYVAESPYGTPQASSDQLISVRPRSATLSVVASPHPAQQHMPVVVATSGSTEVAGELFVYRKGADGTCAATAADQGETPGAQPLTVAQPVAEGPVAASATFTPAMPGAYRVCAYLSSAANATPHAVAAAMVTVLADPALTPLLLAPAAGEDERDRAPLFVWARSGGNDVLHIYDERPGPGVAPLESVPVARPSKRGAVRISHDLRRNAWKVRYLPFMGYGKFWWRVARKDPRSSYFALSEARAFRIVPRPLKRLRVQAESVLGRSSARPGRTRLLIRSSPLARLEVTAFHRGRKVARRVVREGPDARSALAFAWSCNATGRTRYVVKARDRYGNRRTARGEWTVSAARCLVLRQQEQARRRAAERREREQSGGGGGGCHPDYSGCLPITSDLDCDEISDSDKPVRVYGDDPYSLDSDGDDWGCEL